MVRSLQADHSLQARIDPDLLPLLRGWLPLSIEEAADAERPPRATLRLLRQAGDPALPLPGEPTFRFREAAGWTTVDARVELRSTHGCTGHVDLSTASGEVRRPRDPLPPSVLAAELEDVATAASALLLGCLGRALTHAAAVVGPSGEAWLLMGDSGSGKTTTCSTLVGAGWGYLSDDHVVLYPAGEAIMVEGWPRRFNVDTGWRGGGAPTGLRTPVDPRQEWPGRGRRTARVAGVLFLGIEPTSRTALRPVSRADALGRIIRATPWLLGDPKHAPALLAFLRGLAATYPMYALTLAFDSYRDPERLMRALAPLTHQP